MVTDPKQIELSPEMKEAIALKAEQVGRPWDEVLWDAIRLSPPSRPVAREAGGSFYEAMRDLIGIVKDAPSDLSTNPNYLEGFGRDRQNGAD
ncbi:MAG: hypothetical protein WDZ59_07730 [Pirellulales bacterium]